MKDDILPPQAFTSDQVFEAYEWFQKNPDLQKYYKDIKPKEVVSLYLRYKRTKQLQSELKTEELTSTQIFKDDLRAIAEGFKKFEANTQQTKLENQSASSINVNLNLTPQGQASISQPETHYQNQQQQQPYQQQAPYHSYERPVEPAPVNPFQTQQQQPTMPQYQYQQQPQKRLPEPKSDFTSHEAPSNPANPSHLQGFVKLDKKSHAAVKNIQRGLNLSSEDEALRTLIAAGYERMRKIIPVEED